MCGIVGMYNFKRGSLQQNYFKNCLQTMQHRGPDDKDIWHNNENYIAGFVRLSIRDLSTKGRQPMFSSCGKYCISFNGEIYNTATLQILLQPFDVQYHSTSDTEVLLYAIIHLGIEKTLAIADGIFAFAWYDIQQNRLILARDRVGVKPLYAGIHQNGVVYSSQYDHIINHPYFINNGFCDASVGSYLQLGYVPEDAGAVQQTKMLLHGYYYIVENGSIKSFSYYEYGNNKKSAEKNIEHTLSAAAQNQLVSDVPVGSFMSGGVDSTLITYYANQKQTIQSFTIGVKDSSMDESETAQQFAQLFKTKHDCRFIDSSVFTGLIQDHFKAFSEPFADFSSLPTLLLSAFAREKVTVALSGDGGDELFWGYPRNRKVPALAPFYQKKLWPRRLKLLLAKIKDPATTDLARHWSMQNFMEYYYSSLGITGSLHWLPKIFKIKPASSFFLTEMEEKNNAELNNIEALMNMVRKMEVDIHLQRILLKVDRASMFHSLEVRVPFLSNDMLALSESYAYTDCIAGNEGKMNLKKLLIDKAGEKLVLKPKKGFTIPMDEWMRTVIKNDVTEKIMYMPAHLAVMFNRAQLQQLLQQHMSGKQNAGWLIWAIYCLVQWDALHRKNNILYAAAE